MILFGSPWRRRPSRSVHKKLELIIPVVRNRLRKESVGTSPTRKSERESGEPVDKIPAKFQGGGVLKIFKT